ncbi:MAG: amino acid ABC transporter permease [Actinomycetota bacterium]
MELVLQNLDLLLGGMRTTAALAVASFAVALVIGIAVAAFRVSPVPPLQAVGTTYVETIRNIPPLVLLVFFYFGLTKIGILYSEFVTAVIVMGGYTGAFVGEAVRSGVNTVARGQAEAARAVGLTFSQSFGLVILPQALRSVVPAIGSLWSALLRNVSLASVIAVHELAWVSDRLIADTGRAFEVLAVTAIAYLAMTLPSGYVFGVIERKTAIKR